MAKVTIVADAGHGGSDQGTSAGGLNEQAMNLATATLFKQRMEATYADVEVILTRTSDVNVALNARPAVANRLDGDPVFVSFHHNAAGSPTARGFEIYVYGDESWVMSKGEYAPNSFKLAKAMEPALSALCFALGLPYVGVKDGNFAVLRNCNRRAILFESFYASNPQDVAVATKPDFIERLVDGYVKAFGQALGLVEKAKPAPASPFSDVPVDAWYVDDLRFLAGAGIVKGDGNGNYRPNDTLTRAEASRLIRLVIDYVAKR
jgi:N-acetylmuramoyl-L-alanine amidase